MTVKVPAPISMQTPYTHSANYRAQWQNPCVCYLCSLLESQIYAARCKAAVLCDHGNLKGHRDRHQQNILLVCECPLTSRPRAGSCDESKRGSSARATHAAGAGERNPQRRRRRGVSPPCRAAPKSAGCRPPRARRRREERRATVPSSRRQPSYGHH